MYTYCGNNPILYEDSLGTRYVCAPAYWGGGSNYIYDQTADEIGDKEFGNSKISHSGCGVVATYNTLVSLGCVPDFDEIIQSYEQSGNLLFGGLAGMPYRAVADYFADAGYDVSMYTDTELFSYYASQSDASVIWHTWATSSGMGMHFFHVDSVAGLNRGYNVYSNESTVRYLPSNISDFFSGSDGKYSVIICINRR